jgi:hypothetical protein
VEEFIENLKLDEILEKLEDLERKIFFRSLNNKKHSSKSIYIFESIENRLVRLAYIILPSLRKTAKINKCYKGINQIYI